MTAAQLRNALKGLPPDTIIQVWTQSDHTVHENIHVDIITDGPDDEIIQAVHINVFDLNPIP